MKTNNIEEKYYVIVSNQGNHNGYNRTWTRLLETTCMEIAEGSLISYAINYLSDNIVCRNKRPYDLSTKKYVLTNEMLRNGNGFSYDGRQYAIIPRSQAEIFFNGLTNGFMPNFIND